MAKTARRQTKPRASGAPKQKLFEGEGFPKKLPKPVEEAVEVFMTRKRAAAKATQKRGESEVALIEAMKKHKVQRVKIDGENKFIEVESTPKAKVKTVPKAQREGAETE